MRSRFFVLVIALLPLAPTAHAWTGASDLRIANKAAELAPPDLRMLLKQFDSDYKRGLALAQAEELADGHRDFVLSRDGQLRQRIERETASIVNMIRSSHPMPRVVERLGVLAHLTADANNPFHISNDDPRLAVSQNDFEQYFERRMPKFPTVFYGLDQQFRLSSFLDKTFRRTKRFYPLLSEEYFRTGTRRSSVEFDDRSTAFGVASVCYSHAVTDLVNLYYYIWGQSGGDVRAARAMRGSNLVLNE